MYVCIHPARRKQINVDQLLGYAKRERERERERVFEICAVFSK